MFVEFPFFLCLSDLIMLPQLLQYRLALYLMIKAGPLAPQ